MTVHTCRRCNYATVHASNLRKHLEKEIPCEPVDSDHFIPREQLLDELAATKRKYVRKQQVAVPQQQVTIHNHNNLHIHLTPEGWHTMTGMKLLPFGDENGSYVNLLDIVRDNIEDIEKACLECIWRIWFSKDHPENHNTLFRNWHDRVAYVLNENEGGRFYYRDAEEVMRQMLKWVRGMINADMETHGSTLFSEEEYEQIIRGLNDVFLKMKRTFPRQEMDALLRLASSKSREIFPYSTGELRALTA